MSERKAVVKNADMSEDMQRAAIDTATRVRLGLKLDMAGMPRNTPWRGPGSQRAVPALRTFPSCRFPGCVILRGLGRSPQATFLAGDFPPRSVACGPAPGA